MFDKDLLKKIDWITILLVLTLFIIGLTSIASIMADPFDGTEASIADYLDKLNLYYVKKQLVNFMIGFAAMLVFMVVDYKVCLLYTSPSPRDLSTSRMPSSA